MITLSHRQLDNVLCLWHWRDLFTWSAALNPWRALYVKSGFINKHYFALLSPFLLRTCKSPPSHHEISLGFPTLREGRCDPGLFEKLPPRWDCNDCIYLSLSRLEEVDNRVELFYLEISRKEWDSFVLNTTAMWYLIYSSAKCLSPFQSRASLYSNEELTGLKWGKNKLVHFITWLLSQLALIMTLTQSRISWGK